MVSCSFCLTKAVKVSTAGRRINSQCYLRSCRANQAPALWPDPAQQNGGNASVELTPNPTIWELAFAVYLSCSENLRSLTPCGLRAGSCLEKLCKPLANQRRGTHHALKCIGGGQLLMKTVSARHWQMHSSFTRSPSTSTKCCRMCCSLIPPQKKIGLKRPHH